VINGASAACIALANESADTPSARPTRRAPHLARLSFPLFALLFCISLAGYSRAINSNGSGISGEQKPVRPM
jgi:hypothetical protein